MMRQIKGGSGGHSQSTLTVHFGLGQARVADMVEIEWPSGLRTRWLRQEANQRIEVVEGEACHSGGLAGCTEVDSVVSPVVSRP